MKSIQDNYPFFEANQVLSNIHLNQGFDYLEEQERLTRANLIGIGIVCGLEIHLEKTASQTKIHLAKGCGVTSEGYLIVESTDVQLVSFRKYILPSDLPYQPFKTGPAKDAPQYDLWELFPDGEPNTTPLDTLAGLDNKAVILFLELKKEPLRNCSPNNCDDKGAEVTATVRRLLMEIDALNKIIAAAAKLESKLTGSDLESALSARLNLPDLRLPRYDVPNTGPGTSNAVLAAFHAVFRAEKLAANLGAALTAAYNAFKPLVQGMYPADPFATFSADFGFLDDAPTTTAQVRFLQYFYDLFDDLLSAYDEFCWKGVDLLCACCPPGDLFPRHLILGVLFPAAVAQPNVYRHSFLASPATSDCEKRTKELERLFQRLVDMVKRFTHTPPLAPPSISLDNDAQIRITPSKLADVPLSDKAIPYYYLQDGKPPLYQIWNAEKSRRNRANQNLSYRADEYTPAAPAFVQNPLRYDLEPHNFLRIEGHLGKPYRGVLRTLLALRTRHRLPIDIIALRTGVFDENMPVDLSREQGRFQDLETLYDTLREDLLCTLCEGARYLYDTAIEMPDNTPEGFTLPGGTPQLPLLKNHAPNYRHKPNTVGAWYEQYLKLIQSRSYIDVDQNKIDGNQVFLVYCVLFTNTVPPKAEYLAHIVSIYYFTKLAEILPNRLDDLSYDDFENKYQDLMGLIRYFRSDAIQNIPADLTKFIPQEDLIDHFDQVLFACKFDPIKATHEEYVRRIREVKQKQFLSFFLQNHPGIQHKAGVPLGGTFILVYHEDPAPVVTERRALIKDTVVAEGGSATTEINRAALADAFTRIGANPQLLANSDIRFLLGTFTGQIPDINIALPPVASDEASKIINATVAELANGTVIADFFLPYLCCADRSSVQYVLPTPPLGLVVELGCTDATGTAEATLTPQGGIPPITYQLDGQPFRALTGTLLLSVAPHTIVIRDSAGAESAPQSITVPPPLTIGEETYTDDVEANTYTVSFAIAGGMPPYTANAGTVDGSIYTSPPVKSGDTISVTITDSVGCTVSKDFSHTVPVPLGLEVELGCTDPGRTAEATLIPQGGIPPIAYQLDSQSFLLLTGTLSLSVGSHTIVLRDSVGTTSAPRSITVPEPLIIGEETYTDDVEANTYTVSFAIAGGMPPYTANAGTVDGSTYTSPPVKSGDTIGVTIVDSVDCSVVKDFSHTVPEGCNLPCDGQSRRCAYRLWLQPPFDEAPYKAYSRAGDVSFRFNGEVIGLPNANALLRIPTAQLNSDFDNAIGGAIKELWSAINQALIETLGDEGNNRLIISYEPDAAGSFGILWIEYFVCETFNIEFDFSFAKSSPNFTLRMRYTNKSDTTSAPFDGAILINRRLDNRETRVPAFDCSERNRCDNTDYVKLCEGPDPDPTITIEPFGDNQFLLTGTVDNMDESDIIAWVWDLLAARPLEPFYEGQNVQVQVQNPAGPARLTAITQNGCFGIADGNLDQ